MYTEGRRSQGSEKPPRTANAKEHAIIRFIQKGSLHIKEFQTLRDTFYKRVFRGEGATENFRVLLY